MEPGSRTVKSTAKPPRMVDVARQAGVSRMAVSAVLMGSGQGRVRVSNETAERIRRIAADLGYRPNQAARQLAGERSGVLAVIAYDWKNFLTQCALAWLHEAAAPTGLRVLGVHGRGKTDQIQQLIMDLHAGWIDGLVYLAHENDSQWPAVAKLLKHQPRTAFVVGDYRTAGLFSVVSDVAQGAEASMAHLLGQGRTRPIFVTEERKTRATRTRIASYSAAAAALGVPFGKDRIILETKDWLVADPGHYPRFDELARQLIEDHAADSVLCDTDFTAVGLLMAFRRRGVRVPDDVAVVGWGDLQFAGMFDPPITTVAHDLPTLLSRAVNHIQSETAANMPSSSDLVPMRLLVRQSA